MVTVSNNSPRPSTLTMSTNIATETAYLKLAKKGGGRKGLAHSCYNLYVVVDWSLKCCELKVANLNLLIEVMNKVMFNI